MVNPYYQENSLERAYELIKAFLAGANENRMKINRSGFII